MTKEAALKAFFNGFGLKFFPSTAVPNDVEFPYGIYEAGVDNFGGDAVSATAQIWYHTTQESPINAKAREISARIGEGGVTLPCDGGTIWIRRGRPWCQPTQYEESNEIKGRIFNLEIEYFTEI